MYCQRALPVPSRSLLTYRGTYTVSIADNFVFLLRAASPRKTTMRTHPWMPFGKLLPVPQAANRTRLVAGNLWFWACFLWLLC